MKRKGILAIALTMVCIASSANLVNVSAAEVSNGELAYPKEVNETICQLEEFEKVDFDGKGSTDEISDVFDGVEVSEKDIKTFADSGHSTANTALYLDATYLNNVLSDSAYDSENWYYFNLPSKEKISVVLEQPSDGDYDIYLYKYSDDGSLTLISYSINSGTAMENLSAVGEAGYYFLRVVPETASAIENAVYNFMISTIETYDACEPDDMPAFAVEYNGEINTRNTIDNRFDQDWSKLNVSTAGTYVTSLTNIPSGCTYNVYIYDSSFNFAGGMSCDSNKAATISLSAGSYYICVESASGYNAVQPYNLKLLKRKSASSKMITTKTGQIVELAYSDLYVNGKQVDMNWSYHYGINYTRNQDVKRNTGSKFYPEYIENGSYSGPQSVSSSDCIRVAMDNFTYTYFCSLGYDFRTTNFGDGDYVMFYVDAITGKVIDTNINYYYTSLNMPQTFVKY